MNKVFIDQECNLCTSYGNWISEKNKNLEKKYIDDLKKSSTYEEALEVFPDLEILNVNNLEDND